MILIKIHYTMSNSLVAGLSKHIVIPVAHGDRQWGGTIPACNEVTGDPNTLALYPLPGPTLNKRSTHMNSAFCTSRNGTGVYTLR